MSLWRRHWRRRYDVRTLAASGAAGVARVARCLVFCDEAEGSRIVHRGVVEPHRTDPWGARGRASCATPTATLPSGGRGV